MFNKDPLHYHTKVKFDELMETRDKAIRFKINGIKTWMPKKCCRLLNEDEKTVYIWTKVLESNMMKAREYLDNLSKNDLNKDKQKKLINQNEKIKRKTRHLVLVLQNRNYLVLYWFYSWIGTLE